MDRKLTACRDPDGNGASAAAADPPLAAMRERLKSACKKRIQEKRVALFKDMRSQKCTPEEVIQKICNETEQQQKQQQHDGGTCDGSANVADVNLESKGE